MQLNSILLFSLGSFSLGFFAHKTFFVKNDENPKNQKISNKRIIHSPDYIYKYNIHNKLSNDVLLIIIKYLNNNDILYKLSSLNYDFYNYFHNPIILNFIVKRESEPHMLDYFLYQYKTDGVIASRIFRNYKRKKLRTKLLGL